MTVSGSESVRSLLDQQPVERWRPPLDIQSHRQDAVDRHAAVDAGRHRLDDGVKAVDLSSLNAARSLAQACRQYQSPRARRCRAAPRARAEAVERPSRPRAALRVTISHRRRRRRRPNNRPCLALLVAVREGQGEARAVRMVRQPLTLVEADVARFVERNLARRPGQPATRPDAPDGLVGGVGIDAVGRWPAKAEQDGAVR